jgi:signal transduction histidine kinase
LQLLKSPAVRAPVDYVPLLSHILLTPLSGIVLWCEILRRKGELPEVIERGLSAIDRSARAQVAILDNLVELSGAEADSAELHRSRFDLVTCVRDVLVRSASSASQRNVRVEFDRPSGEWAIDGDPVRLRIALYNVVDNAINASPAGDRVDIAIEGTPEEIVVRVSDRGAGIDAALLPELFVLKALDEESRARRGGALGLGLPIARRIVELHGGTLVLTESSPRGCCVTIELNRATVTT